MKYYAVIDTNVIVSAMIKNNSVPGSILELTLDGPIVPLYNEDVLAEYRTVLLRKKFHLTEEIVDTIIGRMIESGLNIEAEPLDLVFNDPTDLKFYEIVMEHRKEHDSLLVTGNLKHYPNEPFVVTPRQMLEIILETN